MFLALHPTPTSRVNCIKSESLEIMSDNHGPDSEEEDSDYVQGTIYRLF